MISLRLLPSFFRTGLLGLTLFAAMPAAVRAETGPALTAGEAFSYKVGWGVFGSAGQIEIAAVADTLDGRDILRIQTRTGTRGLVRSLYTHENAAEVIVDRTTGRLLSSHEAGRSGKKLTEARTDFDYEARLARHRDTHRPGRDTDLALPFDVLPIDLISALVQTREWHLKVGEQRDVLVHFGRDLFPVTIHAEGIETVKTPLGKFATTVLVPRMEKEAPRGLFARGGEIKVWIANDPPHLPVKMQLQLNFGSATLSLQSHTPPPDTAPADRKD